MKFWRRDNIATFALNGLNKNGCHFFGRDTPFKEVFTDPIDTGSTATGILPVMIRTAVTIGVRNMGHPRDEWVKSLFVNYFAGC
jgi:hypothetical protein